eukprot:gnl/TRDRNA2_/TRDRNA2_136205_c0_seq1.p2 gnl/TRDRNA2_/TRDRNA2_136205_c0~~gnl/TRDRNA2_/TRDRNA2_136205_c0_seq1.p2  ORF type:complete len:122 (+),score=3.87 gnl/TRDRNA2_/TRDRNA2_136205_c0_seq1:177-542(+)
MTEEFRGRRQTNRQSRPTRDTATQKDDGQTDAQEDQEICTQGNAAHGLCGSMPRHKDQTHQTEHRNRHTHTDTSTCTRTQIKKDGEAERQRRLWRRWRYDGRWGRTLSAYHVHLLLPLVIA